MHGRAHHNTSFDAPYLATRQLNGGTAVLETCCKIPRRLATKFPLNDKATGNRRSM